jgi:hypothetical protein
MFANAAEVLLLEPGVDAGCVKNMFARQLCDWLVNAEHVETNGAVLRGTGVELHIARLKQDFFLFH